MVSVVKMSHQPTVVDDDKHYTKDPVVNSNGSYGGSHDEEVGVVTKGEPLQRNLKNRHMQMIAIGKLHYTPLFFSGPRRFTDSLLQAVPLVLVFSSVLVVLFEVVALPPW